MGLLSIAFAAAVLAVPAPKVCAVGDWGTGYERQKKVGDAMARFGCTDVLLLGDNFYPGGVESVTDPQWKEKYEVPFAAPISAGVRFHVILGNHDYKGNVDAQLEYAKTHPQWIMPAKHFRFRIGDVCYFAIDSMMFDGEQAEWLQKELPDTTCPWRVVLGHHPAMDRREHEKEKSRLKAQARVAKIKRALKGAQVYLSGHDHGFADEGDQGGFRQIIAGTGGANLKSLACASTQCKFAVGRYGFVHLYTDGKGLRWAFYDSGLKRLYGAGIDKSQR